MKTPRYTTDQIIEALQATFGKVYLAAEKIGCQPSTIYRRAERSRRVAETIEHHSGRMLDIAETALNAALLDREPWAIRFTLQTIGRKRGYNQRNFLPIPLGDRFLWKPPSERFDFLSRFPADSDKFFEVDRQFAASRVDANWPGRAAADEANARAAEAAERAEEEAAEREAATRWEVPDAPPTPQPEPRSESASNQPPAHTEGPSPPAAHEKETHGKVWGRVSPIDLPPLPPPSAFPRFAMPARATRASASAVAPLSHDTPSRDAAAHFAPENNADSNKSNPNDPRPNPPPRDTAPSAPNRHPLPRRNPDEGFTGMVIISLLIALTSLFGLAAAQPHADAPRHQSEAQATTPSKPALDDPNVSRIDGVRSDLSIDSPDRTGIEYATNPWRTDGRGGTRWRQCGDRFAEVMFDAPCGPCPGLARLRTANNRNLIAVRKFFGDESTPTGCLGCGHGPHCDLRAVCDRKE